MLKTLEQINREFVEEHDLIQTEKEKKSGKTTGIKTDIVLYSAIIFILAAMLFFNGSKDKGFQVFGYSGFTVVSGSMQREIPVGALVLDKKVDPNEINIGDDITFIADDNEIVTHRVIDIIENYKDGSEKGFRTQGLENNFPDQDIVQAGEIIGVVKYTVPGLGSALAYISEKIEVFLLVAVMVLASVKLTLRYWKKNHS